MLEVVVDFHCPQAFLHPSVSYLEKGGSVEDRLLTIHLKFYFAVSRDRRSVSFPLKQQKWRRSCISDKTGHEMKRR